MRNKLYLIGYPVSDSPSPQLHNAHFAKCKLPLEYEAREIPPGIFSEALRAMLAEDDFLGANVTIPHKQAAIHYLDKLEGDAAILEAVNTIVRRADGKLVGYNTDVQGFTDALSSALKCNAVKRALVFGSGGAALAVVYALVQMGCERLVVVHRSERNIAKMNSLAAHFNKRLRTVKLAHFQDFFSWADKELVFHSQGSLDVKCAEELMQEQAGNSQHYFNEAEYDKGPRHFDLLVNATPVGSAGEPGVLGDHPRFLRLFHAVFDLVTEPLETTLLFGAKVQGCETIHGRKMLERQADHSRRIWLREYKAQGGKC